MTKRRLNYQHFYYFWRVATRGGVSDASRELRLAQPTISAQLKVFEASIGEKLFVRRGRRLHLTDVGKVVFEYAEKVFATGEDLLTVLNDGERKHPKKITIGIADVVPKIIAYKLIRPSFMQAVPATVFCTEDRTERLLAELAISGLDLVISDAPIPPSVSVKAYNHFLGECSVSFLGSKSLAKLFKRNFPRSLSQAPVLLPSHDAAVRREIDHWFGSRKLAPFPVGEFQDSALMKIVARGGHGIVPVPSVIAREVCKEYNLVILGTIPEIKERFYLISVERRLHNPVVKAIVDTAQHNLFAHI